MPVDVHLHPAAEEEVEEAYRWYWERSQTAAFDFVAAIDAALDTIAETPERPAMRADGTRRVLLRRFPYLLVYRRVDNGVEVIAVAHGRRRPGYWRDRL